MVRTLSQDLENEACTLYVWGNNANSELGLNDDQVLGNIAFYQKYALRKIIKQTSFADESVVQVATGNASSLYLIIDPETRY